MLEKRLCLGPRCDLFLSAGCLLMNCGRDNNEGVIKNVNGACARQPVEFEIIS